MLQYQPNPMSQHMAKEITTISPQSHRNLKPVALFGYAHYLDCCIHNLDATKGRDRISDRRHRQFPARFR